MGQKVNPHGIRVGVIKDWDSRWYAEADFADCLVEDYDIRKFLKNRLKNSGVSKIEIERRESGRIEYSIVGIGINANNSFFPKNIKDKTTSLKLELGKEVKRTELIGEIINEMEKLICGRRYILERKNILREYMERLSLINKKVEIKLPEKKIIGKVTGINDLGGLIILKENKTKEIVYSGELLLK